MKSLLISILLLLAITESLAQRVPSDCTAPDSVIERFQYDAARLAVKRMLTTTQYKDSVRIPMIMLDSSMRALLAVYNTTLPARDKIIKQLNIHTKYFPDSGGLEMHLMDTSQWSINLRNGVIPTGNSTVDSLIREYHMTIGFVYQDLVTFRIHEILNISALAEEWMKIPGTSMVHEVTPGGDGDDILQVVGDTSIKLIYSYGWEDCPAGCIFRRYWAFTIFSDCSVQFNGEYGDPLPNSSINPELSLNNSLYFYPNPVVEKLTVELSSPTTIDILNAEGKVMQSILSQAEKTELSVSSLSSGVYFIRATDKNGNLRSGKFMKE